MAAVRLKVARIGNSRGVRIPAKSLLRYRIGDAVFMEERSDGILLRPAERGVTKLTWDETAAEMAKNGEDWRDWDAVVADGLDRAPWTRQGRVAESRGTYRVRTRSKPR